MPSPTKHEGVGPAPAAKARFEPLPGTIVADKYRVERVIGEGGMGIVVAATHLALDQRVAIKFLLPQAMRHKEAVERFQREARVAAKVNSDHVARVHDVGAIDGAPFIVMEHLDGSDLGQIIKKGGALPISEACEIGLQACEALAEVHAAGIVHRDLKPSNIFVTRRSDGSPCVKLLDFGISKLTLRDEPGDDPALTATATILGSPSYMSPEQLKSTKEVDHRSDVWSLGAVLYEAMTGEAAFRGETVPQVCAMIASDDPAPPSTLREGVPAELERAVLGCLQRRPEKRMHVVDLARALVGFAPERARVSLDRVEALLGEPERRLLTPGSAPTEAIEPSGRDSLPIVPLATSERARTQSTWGEERRRRRGGGGTLLWLVIIAAAVFGGAVYAGKIDVRALRGQIVGVTATVASVVTSAVPMPAFSATAAPSATPSASSANTLQVPGDPDPSPSSGLFAPGVVDASAVDPEESDDDEEDDAQVPTGPITSAAATTGSAAGRSPSARPAPSKPHHPGKPKRGPKIGHRHH